MVGPSVQGHSGDSHFGDNRFGDKYSHFGDNATAVLVKKIYCIDLFTYGFSFFNDFRRYLRLLLSRNSVTDQCHEKSVRLH